MNTSAKLVIMSALISSALWAQKVEVGYDKQADFSQFKTYAWMPRQVPVARPILAAHITGTTDEEFAKKGLQKVDSNPDLLITQYGGVDPEGGVVATDPTYLAYGGTPPPVWTGAIPAVATQAQEGYLTMDVVDAKNKQLLWRGKVKVKLDYEHKEKALNQVEKAVAKLLAKYPPKH
ncbi:MAG: DUF4136 domain-containing protein [Acidobacteriales bacterium]|nr:DUF4136 domain-containing protein [Terriglobales bacterium]